MERASRVVSRRLASPDTKFYLLLDGDVPVGQIRYDRDKAENSAKISFSVAREQRGKNFGTEILKLTTERRLERFELRKNHGGRHRRKRSVIESIYPRRIFQPKV